MKSILTVAALTLGANFAITGLSAQTVFTTAIGDGADTFLSNDSNSGPTVVHGAAETLNLRGFDATRARTILVRFDISAMNAAQISGATLALDFTASNRSRTWTVYGLTDESLDFWSEATTSYSNAPGILATDPGMTSIDAAAWTNLGTFDVVSTAGVQTTDPVSLNLDTHLANDTNGRVSYLFHFTSADSNPDWSVSSKEGTGFAPAMTIPEPSTYAIIFGTFALGGALLRQRRMR